MLFLFDFIPKQKHFLFYLCHEAISKTPSYVRGKQQTAVVHYSSLLSTLHVEVH